MKRPLVGMAIAFVLGEVIAKAGMFHALVVWILLMLWFGVGYGIGIRQKKFKKDWCIVMLPACMGLGIILALQASKIPALDGMVEDGTISGYVKGTVYWKEPSKTEGKWKVYIKNTQIYIPSNQNTYDCRNLLLYIEGGDEIVIGSQIQAKGEVASFEIATNPGQFHARNYYRAKNIDYPVYGSGDIIVLRKPTILCLQWLMKIRLTLLDVLKKICISKEFGIFQAIFLGEKSSIDGETKVLYQANGIAHILAISGLHISLIGNILYQVLRTITGSYKWSMFGGIVLMISYGWITGLAISAIRAIFMFICMMGAQAVGKTYDMLSAAALSALFVLMQYPMQIYEAGFLLTYGAIVGIGGLVPYFTELLKPKKSYSKALLCSFAVQVVTLPILLWFYYTYPIYSLILNLFVIPFAGYLLFSALLGSVVGVWWLAGGKFFIGMGHFVLEYYGWLCHFFQRLPFSKDVVGRPKMWQIVLYYVVVCISVYIGKRYGEEQPIADWIVTQKEKRQLEQRQIRQRKMKLAIVLFISVFLYGMLHPISSSLLQITMLDVDQGDCTCIQMPNGKCILIDGGSTGIKQVGAYRILPYLLCQGIGTIQRVIVTHPDADHMNGIIELIEEGTIEIKQICIPDMGEQGSAFGELVTCAKEKEIPVVMVYAGNEWEWMKCLHPEKGYVTDDNNSYSIIMRLQYGAFSALFMGDSGIQQEDLLQEELPVTLLKVGHHGSKYSSGEAFLKQVQPKVATISCGKKNFYGHPHEEVLERLQVVGSDIWITKETGAIFIKTDGFQVWIDKYVKER